MTNSIYLPNDVYIEAVKIEIAKGKQVRLRTKGQSMIPFITGNRDQIIIEQVNDNSFLKGAILLVQLSEKRFVAHRVWKVKENNMLILRGDGNIRQVEQCSRNNVIAEIIAVIKNGKIIKKGSFRWNVSRFLWPSNPILRRLFLGIRRKIQLIHENKGTVFNQENRQGIYHGVQ